MNLKYLLLTGTFLFFVSTSSFSQNTWTLKLDKDGIRVYMQNLENSPFKAIKAVCTVDASLSRLTAVLMDIPGSVDWVYGTKSCVLLKQVSPSEEFYYSEVNLPWPASNRDFIMRVTASQDEKTKVVTVLGENMPTYLPEKKNIVRVHQSYSKWLITPVSPGHVKVEYTLQVDPAGSLPSWMVNMFASHGPYESFKKLRAQVKKPIYNHTNLPFIRD